MSVSTVLLPHQAAFVQAALQPDAPQRIVLSAPVGTGKTTALAALAAEVLRRDPQARVLVAVPTAEEVASATRRLHALGVPSQVLDRFRFRELIDRMAGETPWATGISVATHELIAEPDVSDEVGRASWQLVLVDAPESGTALPEGVYGAADRVVIAARAVGGGSMPGDTVEWTFDEIVGSDGQRRSADSPLDLVELRYRLSDPGVELLKGLREFEVQTAQLLPDVSRFAAAMRGALLSSQFRYESELFAVAAGGPEQTGDFELRAGLVHWIETEASAAKLPENALSQVLESLDAVLRLSSEFLDGRDNKIERFLAFVKGWTDARSEGCLLVVTDSVEASYICAAELEADGSVRSPLFFDGQALDPGHDMGQSLIVFADMAAVPAAFGAMPVSDVLLYDLPETDGKVEEAFGPASRALLGSRKVRLHLMTPENAGDPDVERRLSRVRERISASSVG